MNECIIVLQGFVLGMFTVASFYFLKGLFQIYKKILYNEKIIKK